MRSSPSSTEEHHLVRAGPAPEDEALLYREYDPDTIRLVRFIKRAQELGFTLREVGGGAHLTAGHVPRRRA